MLSKLDLIPFLDKKAWVECTLLDLFDGAVGYFLDTNCMGKYELHIAYSYNNMELQLLKNSARDHKTKLM